MVVVEGRGCGGGWREKGGCVPPDGDVVGSVEAIAKVVENNMDGTSGALYAIFLNAVGASLRDAGDKLQEERLVCTYRRAAVPSQTGCIWQSRGLACRGV